MHPLGYFASAPDDTPDAAILSELVSRYGFYLARLNSEQKLALRAVLSYYNFYKLKYRGDYSVTDAITDAMPECTEASIRNVILTLEGISSNGAEGLIKFLTEQRSQGLQLPGRVEVTTAPRDSLDRSGQPSFGLSVGVMSGLVNGCPLLSIFVVTHNDTDPQQNQILAIVERLTALTDRFQKIGRRHQSDMAAFSHELKSLLASAQGGQQ